MTDRVHPASKPNTNGVGPLNPPPTTLPTANPAAKPNLRHPYRPQPNYQHNRLYQKRSRRNICCRCCFWTILILLCLSLLAGIAGVAFYVLYHPHRPQFTVSSLRISKLNLTTTSDSSSSHLSSLFNLTLSSLNPNSHFTFFYDPFSLSLFSGSVFIANSSIPAYRSNAKNETVFRAVLMGSEDLDVQSAMELRSDLKKKRGVDLRILMDTKVKVKMGGFETKKVGIRVTCEGIKGVAPKGKSPPTAASVSESECKVDLRIKIWMLTL